MDRQPRLTRRQTEVLSLLAEGLTDRQIADRLGMSVGTARTHVERIRTLFGVRTRGEAVAKAKRTGLLNWEGPQR